MRYTGSVNKFFFYVVIPVMLLLYVGFRGYVYFFVGDKNISAIAETHVAKVKEIKSLEGVVLGGSNSLFSLSAEQLGREFGGRWYNLSLIKQGYSSSNYWGFVNEALSVGQRNEVKYVVYSSIVPFRKDLLSEMANVSHGIHQDATFSLIGPKSVLSSIRTYIETGAIQGQDYPLPNHFGDFDFDQYKCRKGNLSSTFERNKDLEQVTEWLKQEVASLGQMFPKARIYFVLPSEYYGTRADDVSGVDVDMHIGEYIEGASGSRSSLFFVAQPAFPSVDLLCDARHHANVLGREWRTSDLIERLRSL